MIWVNCEWVPTRQSMGRWRRVICCRKTDLDYSTAEDTNMTPEEKEKYAAL